MSLRRDIINLLKEEGFRINETIEDAVDDLLAVVEQENEGGIEDRTTERDAEDDDLA